MGWYDLTSEEIIYLPQLFILGIFGFVQLIVIAKKPNWFWPLLIIDIVGTGGLLINGLSWVDEALVGCLLLGVFLQLMIQPKTFRFAKGKAPIGSTFTKSYF